MENMNEPLKGLRQEEFDKLNVENTKLRELLESVLAQACGNKRSEVDSLALSSYAEGLRYLASIGRFKIEAEYGRRVIGKFTSALSQ